MKLQIERARRAVAPACLAALAGLSGCSDLKDEAPLGPGQGDAPLTFQRDIRPILQQNCASCHSGGGASGGYDLTSLSGLYGRGGDPVRNAIPGDANSLLVRIVQAGQSHEGRAGTPANADALWKWVVLDSMGMRQPNVHPAGWMNVDAPAFHGRAVAQAGWDMAECRSCHGADYAGGIANSSCLTCHTGTPEDCATCHGTGVNPAPPLDVAGNFAATFRGVGAHQAHLTRGALAGPVNCQDCHVVPNAVGDPGHADSGLPAELRFAGLARQGGADPVWDGERCGNTYCHGQAQPRWTAAGQGEAACGTCHGLPPDKPTHPQVEACELCHGDVVDEQGQIVNKALHVNGQVEVSFGHPEGFADPASANFHTVAIREAGWKLAECRTCHGENYGGGLAGVSCITCHQDTPESCTTCHGSAETGPSPPKDLDGHTATTFRGVGAHQSHLSESPITRTMACSECHAVPATYRAEGHIDGALPAEVVFGELATTGGAEPVWNGETCANAYCHGSFDGGGNAAPVWTEVGANQAACGTCHGLPPPPETGHPALSQCSFCHPRVADDNLNILDKSLHINGTVEIGQ